METTTTQPKIQRLENIEDIKLLTTGDIVPIKTNKNDFLEIDSYDGLATCLEYKDGSYAFLRRGKSGRTVYHRFCDITDIFIVEDGKMIEKGERHGETTIVTSPDKNGYCSQMLHDDFIKILEEAEL